LTRAGGPGRSILRGGHGENQKLTPSCARRTLARWGGALCLRASNVLKVGLDEIGSVAQVESISRFHHRLVILDATFRWNKPSILLGSLQLIAEVTGCAERNRISRGASDIPRAEMPAVANNGNC
jgi:hypothetical protein